MCKDWDYSIGLLLGLFLFEFDFTFAWLKGGLASLFVLYMCSSWSTIWGFIFGRYTDGYVHVNNVIVFCACGFGHLFLEFFCLPSKIWFFDICIFIDGDDSVGDCRASSVWMRLFVYGCFCVTIRDMLINRITRGDACVHTVTGLSASGCGMLVVCEQTSEMWSLIYV